MRRELKTRIAAAGRRFRAWGRDESGQGLGYVLVVGAVLLVFVVALVDVLSREMKWLVGSNRRAEMLHAGDGAIDRAVYALQIGGNWNGIPDGSVPGYNADVVYSDAEGVAYTIKVQEGNWTPGVQTGSTKMERTITVCLARTVTGDRKKVQAVVQLSTLNSALFSGGSINVQGNAHVHWGPVISYSTASDSIVNPANWEQHPVYMSAGGIRFGTGANECDAKTDNFGPCAPAASKWSTSPVVGESVYSWADDLGDMPPFPIKQARQTAKEQGTWYELTGNVTIPPGLTKDSVVFFDSCDGNETDFNPYDPDFHTTCKGACGTCGDPAIGCDIKVTGGCGKGTLAVMGTLDLAGNGACPTTVLPGPTSGCIGVLEADPADCNDYTASQLFWDGFIFVADKFKSTGTKQVYGSIYAYDSSGLGGNFDVYYKEDNTALTRFGEKVFTKIWLERKPEPGDVFP